MLRLGITGGIGMGKSACAYALTQLGAKVVDTDALAREVVGPGSEALREITQRFGPDAVDAAGELNRSWMAGIVFTDPAKRKILEEITHPRIREAWKACLQQWATEGAAVAAVVIPLLYETHAEEEFDFIIAVGCTASTQRQRLEARGWSHEHITQRLAAQLPVQDKLQRAQYVVWSEGTLETLEPQLQRILSSAAPRLE